MHHVLLPRYQRPHACGGGGGRRARLHCGRPPRRCAEISLAKERAAIAAFCGRRCARDRSAPGSFTGALGRRGTEGAATRPRATAEELLSVNRLTQGVVRGAVRTTNAVGSALSRVGVSLPGLEERSLRQAAQRTSELEDF